MRRRIPERSRLDITEEEKAELVAAALAQGKARKCEDGIARGLTVRQQIRFIERQVGKSARGAE